MSDVAYAADAAYVPHAATLLRSLLRTNDPATVRAHLLHPRSVRPRMLQRLRTMTESLGASLRCHRIDAAAVRGLPAMGRISRVMWYRLLLPELLADTERVLYLDCDTIVLDDLAPLWEHAMDGRPLAAVTNVFPQDLRHHPERLGLPENGYFNSGVLLMDLDRWRDTGCAEEIARLAREHPERLLFPDQDALNIVLGARRSVLHPRWNCQNSIFYFPWAEDVLGPQSVAEARAEPAILHFEGPAQAKPWHPASAHVHRDAYLARRRETPWPEIPAPRRGLGGRLRRTLAGSGR